MKSINQSMRLFVAIPLPKRAAEELERWTNANRGRIPFRKWTHPQDYHITIQFLGETSIQKIDVLQAALSRIEVKPISLMLNGASFFGAPKSPRVLWAAVTGNLLGLNNFQASVGQVTRALGYVPEDRPYVPHISLARSYIGDNEFCDAAIQSAPEGVEVEADHYTLMRTHMNASPMYETIRSFPLLK